MFAMVSVLFLLVGYGIFAVFDAEIVDRSSGFQSDYKIDAYYYLYLGREAGNLVDRTGLSLYEAADSLRPNAASDGIVFLAAFVLRLVQLEVFVPLILAGALLSAVWLLYRRGLASDAVLLLPFSGLLPYMQGPSKEVFFLMGLLLIAYAVLKPGAWWLGLLGLTLMYFGRREAFYIFGACVLLWFIAKNRAALCLTAAVAVVLYAAWGREPILAAATLTQTLSESADVGFCNVGPLNVCVSDAGGLEFVFATRLLSLVPLPLKWILDGFQILQPSGLAWSEILVRCANVLHLIWLYVVFRLASPVSGTVLALRQVLLLFGISYWVLYATVFYFQPSRQAVLASTIIALGFLVRRPAPAQQLLRQARRRYPSNEKHLRTPDTP